MISSPFSDSNIKRLQTLVKSTSSERERLERIWKDYKEKVFPASAPKDDKSLVIAQNAKEHGNKRYASKDYRGALISYNKALCMAPNDSQIVALIYANRSAVYMAENLPQQCLQNIDLALENGYPIEKRGKLDERRAKCLKLMEELPDYKVNIQPKPMKMLELSHPVNPKYSFLSNAVNVMFDPTLGPQFVANQDLKIGDFFYKEPVFMRAVSSSQDECFIKCSYCLQPEFLSLIPCRGCTTVMFCKECVAKVQGIHQLECPIWTDLFRRDPVAPIHIRTLAHILTMHDLLKLKKAIQECKENREKVLEGDYSDMDSLKKEAFKWLIPHWKPMSPKSWMTEAINSTMLLGSLLQSPPIKAIVSTPDKEITILELLFSFSCETHFTITSPLKNEASFYPLVRRFSVEEGVDFNAMYNYDGSFLFGHCIRPVKKGQSFKMASFLAFPMAAAMYAPLIPLSVLYLDRKVLLSYFKSRLPAALSIPKNVNIPNFNIPNEIHQIFASKFDPSPKNMNRLIRLLNENMHLYPCFELTAIMFVYVNNFDHLYADDKYLLKTNMMPAFLSMMK